MPPPSHNPAPQPVTAPRASTAIREAPSTNRRIIECTLILLLCSGMAEARPSSSPRSNLSDGDLGSTSTDRREGRARARDARRARGRLAAATRATTAGTQKIPVAERLHARRQEHGADDRRVDARSLPETASGVQFQAYLLGLDASG